MDDLASEFDVIVLGTGLGSSLLAGALGRIGKNVLQGFFDSTIFSIFFLLFTKKLGSVDRNDYYGSDYASFTVREIKSKSLSDKINLKKCELEAENRVTINLGQGL